MGFESISLTRRTLNYFVYIEELLNIKPCLVKFKEENMNIYLFTKLILSTIKKITESC